MYTDNNLNIRNLQRLAEQKKKKKRYIIQKISVANKQKKSLTLSPIYTPMTSYLGNYHSDYMCINYGRLRVTFILTSTAATFKPTRFKNIFSTPDHWAINIKM